MEITHCSYSDLIHISYSERKQQVEQKEKNLKSDEERCVKKLKVVNKESADYKASEIIK